MAGRIDGASLWTKDQEEAAARLAAEVEKGSVEVVRFLFADQHGVLRGKALTGPAAIKALRGGVHMTTTLVAKDTSHRTVFPVFTAGGGFGMPQMQGASDMLMMADPSTWRVLPWARNNAWVLSDLYFPDGTPVPFCTRRMARRTFGLLDGLQCTFTAGLEVEFHIFRVEDKTIRLDQSGQPGTPPEFSLLTTGAQYLTELTYDSAEPILEILRRNLLELGLPLVSMELEFGPSQFEFTFAPTTNLQTADNMVLIRTAIKEVCRRCGLHATFMCRPKIPNVASSGWHLHQSLSDAQGRNMFMPEAGEGDLSAMGRHFLGGLLEHACGASALAAPTINAYKRYRPYSLAPDRAVWARDNRGAMLRAVGGAGDPATRLENRAGEPGANPYLYIASQVVSGVDGIRRQLDPGPAADAPYESGRPALPRTLGEALAALRADGVLNRDLGKGFVDYFCHIKDAEIRRFEAEVTEWEHREYFDLF
jgi:glutamine synthetase